MPSLFEPKDCSHIHLLKKAITLSEDERELAARRGMSTPHVIYVHLCLQCWSINPRPSAKSEVSQ